MYTILYTEHPIPPVELGAALARATDTPEASVAVIASSESDGAGALLDLPGVKTHARYWTVPGEFPFVIEVSSQAPGIGRGEPDIATLHRIAASFHQPVLSLEDPNMVKVVFPDGSTLFLNEDERFADESLFLTARDRRRFVEHAAASLAAD